MKFTIDPKIFEKYPGVEIGVIVIKGMDNSGRDEGILKLLRMEEANQKKLLAETELGSLAEIAAWREIYRSFGSHPKDDRSSIEALLRRARAGNKEIPHINKLVDLYNYLSLKHHLPAGAEDLDKIKGDIRLTFADGSEEGKTIGSEQPEKCDAGEVFYRDDESFICRKWNWREADRTKIGKDSGNAVLVIEKAPPVFREKLEEALAETEGLIKKHLKAETEISVLSGDIQSMNLVFIPSKKEAVKRMKVPPVKITNPLLSQAESFTAEIVKNVLFSAVKKLYPESEINYYDIKLEHPSNENYGDYSSNIAMIMASKIKIKPIKLAENISRELNDYIGRGQSISYISHSKESKEVEFIVSDILENSNGVVPGFINLKLAEKFLISQMGEVPDSKKSVKTVKTDPFSYKFLTGKKLIFEFTDPNPFKEFHIGHLYSNAVGETIARTSEELGADVRRANYFGDVGMHVAKSIWGMKKLDKKMEDKSLGEKVKYLGEAYALGATAYGEDDKAKEEMTRINFLVFIAAQEYMQKKMKWIPQIDYRQFIRPDEKETEEVAALFEKGREWSLAYFESIYERLGTKFDYYYPESIVGEYGMQTVKDALEKGIFEKSDGAVVFHGEKYGLHTRVFVNALGLPTYEAKELGLAPTKYKDFQYDFSMIITAKEINEYFQVLLKVLSFLKPELAAKTRHLGHGIVRLPEGKMSSRTGKIVTGEKLLEMVKAKLKERLDTTKSDQYTKEESELILEKTAVAAVKYSMLKVALPADLVFDLEKSVNFDGDSGPYLQYTYARCRSVLRKAEESGVKRASEAPVDLNKEEKNLLRTFYKFEEAVLEAGKNFSPSTIAGYLYDLAQKYNLFYSKHSILGKGKALPATQFRIALTQTTSEIVKKGLWLLGIETVEKM
ncbi:MAG: arginyl-tRNA synthetase, arginyl-tRNA synthetase [Candidatus Gottesmanbacteria bacterium GW2011_GWA2_43_14]|uniref:Arginine--tRNA ligase n=1 Tax=Candidatus Gottesmanbacteria bacterium GW2011_GWA2_43_14 TaxID=1618443 RepID=A0A0G1DJB2_9BACT|nr:MAG: arginyl-tRNA synthetase, arginyl-tRNA synthetase [Candidatus Gottesmanbacteria bacterium GW2011_GWA2_43_14]